MTLVQKPDTTTGKATGKTTGMEVYCTRPSCPRPNNVFPDLDDKNNLTTTQQKYCTTCGMPIILAGRYLPLRLLGQGGFGAAFLARDRYTPAMRPCVVKQFQPSGDLTSQQRELAQNLFQREAVALEELGNAHPNIPNLLAFFPLEIPSRSDPNQNEQFFYLVQEYIDGQNLEQELEQKGKFSEAEILEVLRSVLDILRVVHEKNAIHRDIKPANIMRNQDNRLYLLDFGAVKRAAMGGTQLQQQGASTGIFSMGFAPPEQMSGSTVYPATDLYALAVTCITLLTGRQPMDLYDSYSNQWNWHEEAKVSDLTAAVLDKLLQATPSDRFQAAEEVLAALPESGTASGGGSTGTSSASIGLAPTQQQSRSSPSPPAPSPAPAPSSNVPATASGSRSFSMVEVMAGAAFTGFEGSLLYLAAATFVAPGLSMAIAVLLSAGLAIAQNRRLIEGKDLPILGAITVALVILSPLSGGILNNPLGIATIAVVSGAVAIAVTAIFQLVRSMLANFL
ncbi:serine/threonine-protein kinase [Geitlerinema sp. PCC 9228]|jgi:serine/threonine-protein kinase|uniref:serine/threonine-protein kinase n=1 Tax=Geitlerinema sp. PCC 9228 TaxID=111611 RepID=UPI001FCCC80A|nr:serine/threonine-protein kinase [Geitlerinema sp. PCC 9228]